ncbi:MAG: hypothetical protein WHS65_13710 [Melioribacteraceae bacterium]
MKLQKTNRRKFLTSIGFLSTISLLTHCKNLITEPWLFGGENNNSNNNADLILTGSEKEIASKIKEQYSLIEFLANNINKEKTIAYYDNGQLKKLSLSIVKDKLASYPYLRITKKESNESVNILWGMDGIYPSLKFVDNTGKLIEKNGHVMEFALKKTEDKDYSPTDWLKLGIKIFAYGLLIWLGATVLKYVVSAISFIAFNALVLGIVIAGITLIVPIIKWLINLTGWKKEDIKDMFNKTINDILAFLLDVQKYLLER